MSTIIIAGGTGMIGSALTAHLLSKAHEVIVLTRSAKQPGRAGVTYAKWDLETMTIDKAAIARADHIIHVAGAGVADKRWTDARKKEIVESRTKAGALLYKALKEIPNNIQSVVSASAIGWYGDDKKRSKDVEAFTEEMPADDAFLGDTCRQWEESVSPITSLGKRLVILRIGIVLSKKGGALAEFIKPVKMGIAGFLGSGKQVVSWIHIDDLARLFTYAIENVKLNGVYNAVAPEPVTNKQLTLELATRLRGKFYVSMHVPAFVLKAMLGGMSIEVLKSAKVSSEKIRSQGFQFLYPTLDAALPALLK